MARPLAPKTIALFTNTAMVQDTGTYSSIQTNRWGYTRARISVKAASEVGTAFLDVKVQTYNTVTNEYYDMAGASLAQISAATGPIDLVIGPGLTAVANRVVSQPLPGQFKVVFVITDATTEGFTVNAEIEFLP